MTVRIGYRRETDTGDRPRVLRHHFSVAVVTWAVGAGLFLCLAATAAAAALSTPDDGVPRGVTADQQARTELAANQVRRAIDGGTADLAAVAAGIEALPAAGTPARLLSRLVSTRSRYRGAAYLSPTGEVRARAGAPVDTAVDITPAPAVLVRAPHVSVSVPVGGTRAGVLVAELAQDTLTAPLSGGTHLFDAGGRDLDTGSMTATAVPLPAARPGSALRDVGGRPAVVTWAPVEGQPGLTVVTDRPEPPHGEERHELLLFGVLVATLAVVVFGWLHVLVIAPLAALAKAEARLARGETGEPVIVRRFDHLGLIARDLERLRRDLPRRDR
ncbi:hypothetical protein [Actinophytocola oryzae]|uniref:HAMP domain-containing protein n=1 Tax=Actinophytocola oryzae TaxID=502181 RepID=A0A4R7VHG1_9PSEU|nr:hypothetical protein [Actinophytocola oryzae]TDV48784.1 hypothetical protein CLV71_108144 [Actinophytocola oryzae]